MPNLLYTTAHPWLERSDVDIFTRLGFNVFSTGYFQQPDQPTSPYVTALPYKVDKGLYDEFKQLNPNYEYGYKIPLKLTKEFVDKFDVVVITWRHDYLKQYWNLLKDKLVIFQTVGQSDGSRESQLQSSRSQGVKIVRMSKTENSFANYAGADAFIDLAIDTSLCKPWVGDDLHLLTINKMLWRKEVCNTDLYLQVTKGLPRRVYGTGNENFKHSFSLGPISQEDKINELSRCRASFSLGTKPCPCVLTFKEALAAGSPVVTWGPKLGNQRGLSTYTAHTYIENGVNGFYSDKLPELRSFIDKLFADHSLAKSISDEAIKTAQEYFSIEVITKEWRKFFKELGIYVR